MSQAALQYVMARIGEKGLFSVVFPEKVKFKGREVIITIANMVLSYLKGQQRKFPKFLQHPYSSYGC